MISRSGVKRYRCYGKDDFGHLYDARSREDEYGEWCKDEDVAALEAENERLRAAVADWVEIRRRVLSKSGITGGHAVADLYLLEEAIEAALSPAAGES